MTLRVAGADLLRTRSVLARTVPGLEQELRARLIGLDKLLPAVKNGPQSVPIHYVLVVADHQDLGFEPVLQPLVEWKRDKGFQVTVLRTSQTGSTKEQIKAALRALYETPAQGLGVPAYVVLVGDVQYIPYWEGRGDGENQAADMYYATMDAPDANYGRRPCPGLPRRAFQRGHGARAGNRGEQNPGPRNACRSRRRLVRQ